jgi:hypothetical protein
MKRLLLIAAALTALTAPVMANGWGILDAGETAEIVSGWA